MRANCGCNQVTCLCRLTLGSWVTLISYEEWKLLVFNLCNLDCGRDLMRAECHTSPGDSEVREQCGLPCGSIDR